MHPKAVNTVVTGMGAAIRTCEGIAWRIKALVGAAALAWALGAGPAAAEVKVGVILSTSGPAASQGAPQLNTVPLLPASVGGQAVRYIVLDDGTDAARAVAHATKLIEADKVDALIGSTTTPASLAMLEVAAAKGVPMISLATSSRVVAPMDEQRRWVFKTSQNDSLMSDAIAKHMRKVGVRSVGFIGFDDALGEGWRAEIARALEPWQIKLLATEKFKRTDADVGAQTARLMAAKPDAVMIGGSGTPSAVPLRALRAAGYGGKIYLTHGVANPDFLRAGGKEAEGAFLPVGPVLVVSQLPDAHPVKATAEEYVRQYEAKNGEGSASTLGAYMFDAGVMLNNAIPVAMLASKPGNPEFRAALRQALETAYDLPLTNGVAEVTADDHSGLDARAHVMVTVANGNWKVLPRDQQ